MLQDMYGPSDLERLEIVDEDGVQGEARVAAPTDDVAKRQDFARDYDRIIHTTAFRRLQGKTQVVTPGQADFFRTRLTHTIEVAQIARRLASTIGRRAKIGADNTEALANCCEAAAALHDIGHPPFGHVGEEALTDLLDKIAEKREWDPLVLGGYEGNAQNIRLASWSISHGTGRGLGLTRAVLDASIKYPNRPSRETVSRSDQSKWNFFPSEVGAYGWIRQSVPPHLSMKKSFESEVMDWSDDVAYATHDLEDWCRAGYIPLAMLAQSLLAREYFVDQIEKRGKLKQSRPEITNAVTQLFAGRSFAQFADLGTEFDGSLRAKEALAQARSDLFDSFTSSFTVEFRISGGRPCRYEAEFKVDPEVRLKNEVIKEMLWIYVIRHPRMSTHQAGQKKIVRDLLKRHLRVANDPLPEETELFPVDARESFDKLRDRGDMESRVEFLRLVTDHVAGMTDGYAQRLRGRLDGLAGDFNVFI